MSSNNLKELKIGDLTAKIPIIQGGMGVGVSLSGLASAVAKEGGIGVISSAGIGMLEPDFSTNFNEANKRALRKEIRKAKKITTGIIGVNIMVALSDFDDHIQVALDEGADAIMMCVDYGHSKGPWLSPRMFREFIKPALEKQVNAFKRKGGFTILHSDGNIWPLLPDIIDTGLDAYQGIDVEAGMNLAKVKEFYGDKICLIGNFDPRVIEFGSRADILNEVKRCLNQGAPGGGYVFSTSANASICLNVDNFILMLNYVKKRRSYQKARI